MAVNGRLQLVVRVQVGTFYLVPARWTPRKAVPRILRCAQNSTDGPGLCLDLPIGVGCFIRPYSEIECFHLVMKGYVREQSILYVA